ncbi:MAG: hypothetical protein O9318_07355 [Hylemonella sp.]|uniref:hypothetical protein n=1 Tax=Hylemonella sp. TaxID=2066020 RepID=UPI0022C9D436|nr:hypothetical protein [Hylemonella sp.]MCZ8252270.1 hypothetical protein [Hylemonella sp.]
MKEVAISLTFRLLLAVAALAAGWMFMGLSGVVFFSPIAGICLARPLLEKMAGLYYGAKASALQEFQGRYFAFRGVRFDVQEDEQQQLWLKTADVRTLLPSFPRDGVLLKLCDDGLAPDRTAQQSMRVRADTLDRLLSNSRQLETIKFRNWLQKDVIFPGQQRADRNIRSQGRRSQTQQSGGTDHHTLGGGSSTSQAEAQEAD